MKKNDGVARTISHPGNYLVFSVLLLIMGTAVTTVQYKVPSILGPLMADYGMTSSAGSLLMSVFTAVGIFLSIPAGSLVKRVGPKGVLMLGCGVIVLGSVVGSAAGTSLVFIASRLVEGVAFVLITVAAPLAIEKYVSLDNQGTANGIWALWICFGSVIGSTATPVAFDAFGMTGTWLLYAAFVVAAAVVLALYMRKMKPIVGEGKTSLGDEKVGLKGYLSLLKVRPLLFLFAYLVFNIEILAVLSYTPTFLQQAGMDASLSGFASSLPGLLAIVSSPLFGKLADRTGKTKPFYLIALMVSIPATFLMMTQSGPLLWFGAFLMGFVGYGVPVLALTALPRIAGSNALMPAMVGLFMLVQSLGEFLGSFLVPLLLGPAMGEWTFCASVISVISMTGVAALALCKFK
ncbi:MAG: MFS transporter [Coriobacteriia bacterium]|nr:MFS transporter [Coriobacteriia bacterium]